MGQLLSVHAALLLYIKSSMRGFIKIYGPACPSSAASEARGQCTFSSRIAYLRAVPAAAEMQAVAAEILELRQSVLNPLII